jgi:HD-GYP domain-containing protein (c-di-GMP phosphodiesterase class II)
MLCVEKGPPVERDPAQGAITVVHDPTPTSLVVTSSSDRPPADPAEERWRRRPAIAATIRVIVIAAPLLASVCAGLAAGRLYRPHGWVQTAVWVLWTAAVSVAVLAAVDAVVRRLLPLQRLLQLCLVFPDKAPSRLRVAARAARLRRSEQGALTHATPQDAGDAVTQIVTLLGALAKHDRRTRGHSERVCVYTELIADEMELAQRERDRLMWVALIHDIGKLEVPPRLLNKPSRPTLPEWQVLQSHPHHGDRIIAPLRPWLGPWADAVLQHHERHDGVGYPHGLAGDELCLGARIIAVADAFEVMTAPRPYRRPVNAAVARSELARHAGTQFDPEIVRHFLAVGLPRLRKSMGLLSWLAQVPFVRGWPKLQSTPGVAATQAGTATLVASSAGVMLLAPAAAPPAAAHEAAPVPHTQSVTGPGAAEPTVPQPIATVAPVASAAPARSAVDSQVTTGWSSSAATVAPADALSPTTSSSASAAASASGSPTCAPHDHGQHRGWVHRPTPPKAARRHSGCG